uniref:CKLF like MARVEL transmembrane domain containing 6 n=1 Tax=Malurus cyaneus samueli TaxID=2593467 RepID=A0A8C5TPC7_9PASS
FLKTYCGRKMKINLIQLKNVTCLQILSFVAVVCEEIVEDCTSCSGLYFFEFISCSAFLLSLLILFVYCTEMYESLGEDKVPKLNFWALPVIGAWFLIASIVFSANNSGSAAESAAYVSLKMARFTLYLSGMLISLPLNFTQFAEKKLGRTQCVVMFQEELAISDLPETYCRKSKELTVLRVAEKFCVHLQLPTFCLLLWMCIISCHLLLFNIVIS